jgi:hypothetical protein
MGHADRQFHWRIIAHHHRCDHGHPRRTSLLVSFFGQRQSLPAGCHFHPSTQSHTFTLNRPPDSLQLQPAVVSFAHLQSISHRVHIIICSSATHHHPSLRFIHHRTHPLHNSRRGPRSLAAVEPACLPGVFALPLICSCIQGSSCPRYRNFLTVHTHFPLPPSTSPHPTS